MARHGEGREYNLRYALVEEHERDHMLGNRAGFRELAEERFGPEHGEGGFQGDYGGGGEQGGFGGYGDYGRGRTSFSSHPDAHYLSWRDRHMRELDRDYDEYRRERQQQFHADFSAWRRQRHAN